MWKQPIIEHYVVGDQISGETLNNLGSIFNGDEMTVKNLNVTGKFNIIPAGSIIAWSGTTPPGGWALCDGSAGRPDLRGRFILGFGQGSGLTNRTINQLGGEENHLLALYEMPSHTHKISSRADDSGYCKTPPCGFQTSDRDTDNSWTNVDDTTWMSSIARAGGNIPHNNMPPFYVLAYIIKL
jgi:microcystin-dependent protein